MVVGTDPLGGRVVLQGHSALPAGGLSGPDHAVDLVQTLGGSEETGLRSANIHHFLSIEAINFSD